MPAEGLLQEAGGTMGRATVLGRRVACRVWSAGLDEATLRAVTSKIGRRTKSRPLALTRNQFWGGSRKEFILEGHFPRG